VHVLGLPFQTLIDLAPQLVPGEGHAEDRDTGDCKRGSACGGETETSSEVHGGVSLSTYPIPRTVWINRGRSSRSVLRRR